MNRHTILAFALLLTVCMSGFGQDDAGPWLPKTNQKKLRSLMPKGVPMSKNLKFYKLDPVYQKMYTMNNGRSKFNDIGHRVVGRGSLFFDDVVVPEEFRLGPEGSGFTQVMNGFDYSRALIALECVGAARASLDEAWAYSKERQAFGRPIGQFQGVSFPLAEGESIIEAVRQLAYHTLQLREAGLAHTSEAAMCKWLAPKTAVEAIHQCLLTHGHYGWSLDLPHQQRLRDVMGLEIGDGTAQIMKLIIAREALKATGLRNVR